MYKSRADAVNLACCFFGIIFPHMFLRESFAVHVMNRQLSHKNASTSAKSFGKCLACSAMISSWHFLLLHAGSRQCLHVLQCLAMHGGLQQSRQRVLCLESLRCTHIPVVYSLRGFRKAQIWQVNVSNASASICLLQHCKQVFLSSPKLASLSVRPHVSHVAEA